MTSRKPKKVLSLIIALTMLLTLLPATLGFAATEDIEAFVTRLYVEALDRQPEAEGLAYWVNELETGNKTAAQVVGFILVDAPEFAARNLSDDEFMDVVYRAFLNREPDAAGKAFWMSKLDEGYSRRWIMSNMMTAPTQEFQDFCAANNIKVGRIGFTGADLPPAVPDELEVEAVTAINLKQLAVEFNMNVENNDDAKDKANYTLENADGDEIELADIKVNDDTIIISIADVLDEGETDGLGVFPIDNQDEAVLTIDDAITGDELDFDVGFFDATIPTATKAEVVGSDTIKVYFSEPIAPTKYDSTDNVFLLNKNYFEVEDGDYFIKRVELYNNNTEANIVLYSDLDEGTIKVNVDDAEDYAGFGVVSVDLQAIVVEDNEGPEVIGYKDASKTGVTLIFNEDIKLTEDADPGYIYHTNSRNIVDAADVDDPIEFADDAVVINGNEMTLSFTQNELPEGIAYVYVEDEALVDLWGNENDTTLKVEIEVTIDEIKPEVEKVEQGDDEKTIKVTFTENVKEESAKDEDNYTILDDEGNEIDDNDIDDITVDGDVVTIILEDKLDGGDYAIAIEDIEDESENVIDDVTVEFSIDDKTPPSGFTATLYGAGEELQTLLVDFGEKMATGSSDYAVDDLDKYAIFVDGSSNKTVLADAEGTKIKVVNNGKGIEITIPYDPEDGDTLELDSTATYKMEIGRVADAAGNKMEGFSVEIPVIQANYITIDTAEATATDVITVTFTDELVEFDADDLTITAGSQYITPARVRTSLNSDGNTVVTFKLASEDKLNYNGTYGDSDDPVIVAVISNQSQVVSENKYGKPLEAGYAETVTDEIAPVLVNDGIEQLNEAEIRLTFEEAVNWTGVNDELAATDFVIKDEDNNELVAGVDYTIETGSLANEIDIVLNGDYVGYLGDLDIITSSTVRYIVDGSDNKLGEIDETLTLVARSTGVTQDPGFTGGNNLTYTFKEGTLNITGTDVPFVTASGGFPPADGYWIGVAIDVPETVNVADYLNYEFNLTVGETEYNLTSLDYADGFWFYFSLGDDPDTVVTSGTKVLEIEWTNNGLEYFTETITINYNVEIAE